jgi:hypothetical protein
MNPALSEGLLNIWLCMSRAKTNARQIFLADGRFTVFYYSCLRLLGLPV